MDKIFSTCAVRTGAGIPRGEDLESPLELAPANYFGEVSAPGFAVARGRMMGGRRVDISVQTVCDRHSRGLIVQPIPCRKRVRIAVQKDGCLIHYLGGGD